MVQWLRRRSSTARGTDSIPGRGTKISYAVQCGQNIKNLKTNKNTLSLLGGNVLGGMVLGSWKRRWPSLSWRHRPGALVHDLASAEDAPAGDVLLLTAGSSVERLLLPVGSSPFLSREARPLAGPGVQSRAGGPWTPAPTRSWLGSVPWTRAFLSA